MSADMVVAGPAAVSIMRALWLPQCGLCFCAVDLSPGGQLREPVCCCAVVLIHFVLLPGSYSLPPGSLVCMQ